MRNFYNSASLENRKIFYWGSKPLGLKCFEFLIDLIKEESTKIQIIGVCVSEQDIRKDGIRGQNIRKIAHKYKIPLFTELDNIKISGDLGICVGYPHKINKDTILKYRNGIINLHFAPLPNYRGSKTLSHAILNNEINYGLTFHYIDATLDTGPIISVKWYKLPQNKTAVEITKELEVLAFSFFKKYIHRMIQGKLSSTPQNIIIKQKKITPKFYKRNSLNKLYKIPLNTPSEKIYRIVRAITVGNNKIPYIEKYGEKTYLRFITSDFVFKKKFYKKLGKYMRLYLH